MPAAPLPLNESDRLEALLACNVLDTEADPRFDDLTQLAMELCETPIALVSLVDRHRQWFKSCRGLDVSETPRDQAFCGYVVYMNEPLVILNAATDARTADNPLVTSPPHIRFYAGQPLRLWSGEVLGTLCVIDTEPRDSLPDVMLDRLGMLARQAASQLDLLRANTELDAARREAERANNAKSAFLANMSHEIRTPLTAVVGYAELISDHIGEYYDPDLVAEASGSLRRNSDHLLALINDILDVSKIEAGQMRIEIIETDFPTIIADAMDIVRPRLKSHEVLLNVTALSPLPRTLRTDPTRIRQVLVNLLGNAAKFTDEGSISLTCAFDQRHSRLTIEVSDTGIGMTPQQLERISRCDAFVQADSSTTRHFGGSGLGLKISKALMEILGGSLRVESRWGVGSTFTLQFDAHDTDPESLLPPEEFEKACRNRVPNQSEREASMRQRRKVEQQLEGCRVMLVEDGPHNQRLVGYHLRGAGAEVEIAKHGAEALEIYRGTNPERPFDLIIMDMQMPIMDGYEATRRLRDMGAGTPIIALTANAMVGDRARCLEAGCDDYQTKPISRDAFLNLCAEVINGRRDTERQDLAA